MLLENVHLKNKQLIPVSAGTGTKIENRFLLL